MEKNESVKLLFSMLSYHFEICKSAPMKNSKDFVDFSITPSTSNLRFVKESEILNINGNFFIYLYFKLLKNRMKLLYHIMF